ncbi:MAG TPA: TetR family transcriptional regulator [Acidimicrobiales bacterium]
MLGNLVERPPAKVARRREDRISDRLGDATDDARATEAGNHRPPRRAGRPPRIDRETIARTAAEVGLDRVTMKAVADRLGVSVPGLYHHVGSRDDLVRLAAEYAASHIEVPRDRGQHWSVWLLEWAQYVRAALTSLPDVLGQFLSGSIGMDRMVDHLDAVIALMTTQGFSPAEAIDAFRLVSATSLGVAVGEIREAREAEAGRSSVAEYHRLLAHRPPAELTHIRRLVGGPEQLAPSFDEQIRTVLVGIAARRGEPWEQLPALAADVAAKGRATGFMHP